jgi:hypothetical protein
LFVGRREDALVAAHDGRDGQAHAGIPGRAFDDRAPGFQQPGALGVVDHLHRHAVFDRVAWIEGLDLGEHRALDHAARDAVDADHRRVADRFKDVRTDVHWK